MLRRTLIAGSLVPLGIAVPAAEHRPIGHTPPAGSPFTSSATNRAAARRWGSRLISELQLPAGAERAAGKPAGVGTSLDSPGFSLTSPQLVDDTSWWTIDEPSSTVVAFVRAHLPHARRIVGSGVGSESGRVTDAFWSYAPPPGLSQLTAAVQTDALAGGRTAVRLDGEATWLVPRPAWDRIPGSVRSVTYTARATVAGLGGGRPSQGRRSAPRTLGRRDARRLAAAIDRLQRIQPGVVYSCPVDAVEPRITLRFRGAGGDPLAVAVDRPSGCASLSLSVRGRRGPPLGDMVGRPLSIEDQMVALGAIGRCRSDQLVAGPASLALAAHRPTLTLSVRDRSDAACTVRGFPRVRLVGLSAHVLAGRNRNLDPGALRHEPVGGAVILYPGTSAQFTARYRTCPGHPAAVTARIRVPGTRSDLLGRLASTGRRVTPCGGTVLRVDPLSPAL
ncbi:MAG TPA: DUF4232 domain-containing protein [Solirubrobacteraceae bacterium]|nr:DUF4232 domain-containing protein [Solirubrobacteraceae bacterium]